MDQPVRPPDLSTRPHELTVERVMKASPGLLYAAWTQGLDLWLAVPGSVLMRPVVNEPLYFDTGSADKRNPHYGRILTLEPDRRIEFTWVTAATDGVETVVAAEFRKQPRGIRLRLRHSGFPTAAVRDLHQQVWPEMLERLDEVTSAAP
ncbi:ATPase [Nocardia mangyaensis]|uniref:ATPase n=1 Tax=Nocardia mangyaensis TaxID=2213200 RepID=A0A1J0VLM5_9NOCA|nr:SRPBCC domain-containing protein [Nocardia mangyaensis]APE32932.1 ATPase [Nocardia mangyaensis]MDO3651110.1 SRPBCC domain-containing protein [Nocardia mangyaensis]